jgi:hypothetical protein
MLLVAAPAAGAKKSSRHGDAPAKACKAAAKAKAAACTRKAAKATAAKKCRDQRSSLGDAGFRARYGGKRKATFGRCVTQQTKAALKKVRPATPSGDDVLDEEELDEDEELGDEFEDDPDDLVDPGEDDLEDDPDAGSDDADAR